jgi:hypothetical protein
MLRTLLTRSTAVLHKSELSPYIVVFDVAFLVICYVSKLPRLGTAILHKGFQNGNYFSSARAERYAKFYSSRAKLIRKWLTTEAAVLRYGRSSRPLG